MRMVVTIKLTYVKERVGDHSRSMERGRLRSILWEKRFTREKQMDLTSLIVQIVAGAIGGSAAGAAAKQYSLGTLGNAIAGAVAAAWLAN